MINYEKNIENVNQIGHQMIRYNSNIKVNYKVIMYKKSIPKRFKSG